MEVVGHEVEEEEVGGVLEEEKQAAAYLRGALGAVEVST